MCSWEDSVRSKTHQTKFKENHMKKIAAMFLGLSLMVGATSMFAADDTKTTKTTKSKKPAGKKKVKKTDTSTEKKS
jgi:hypothetical protein